MILDKVILLFGRPYTIVLVENIEKSLSTNLKGLKATSRKHFCEHFRKILNKEKLALPFFSATRRRGNIKIALCL